MHIETIEQEAGLPGDDRRAPERSCAVTRRSGDLADLIRFVAGPDGQIVPDLAHKLPGRGVWLTAERPIVVQAVRQRTFARAYKRAVVADAGLAELVGELMLRRVIEHLSIANKAGQAVSGFTKVDRALERAEAFALLHASDGAEDGARKLDQKFVHVLREANVADGARDRRIVRFLTSEELSLAMGRTNVVHVCLAAGGASRNFLSEAERLLRYRLGATAGT